MLRTLLWLVLSIQLGDGVYYMCGLDGQLYVGKEAYKALSSLTPMVGVSCTFNVALEPAK